MSEKIVGKREKVTQYLTKKGKDLRVSFDNSPTSPQRFKPFPSHSIFSRNNSLVGCPRRGPSATEAAWSNTSVRWRLEGFLGVFFEVDFFTTFIPHFFRQRVL